MYSSRTRYNTDVYRRIHNWKTRLRSALAKIPEDQLSDEERELKEHLSDLPEIAIMHLIYQQKVYEGHDKDYEFSGTSMNEHWLSGYEDTKRTLKHKDWLTMPAARRGPRGARRASRRRIPLKVAPASITRGEATMTAAPKHLDSAYRTRTRRRHRRRIRDGARRRPARPAAQRS